MKKIIAFLLISVLLVSLFSISAGAALPPVVFGDLNRDYKADILDVTLIRRGLVGAIDFGYETQLRADFDRDGEATVLDATWIQRKEASMTIPESFGGEGYADIDVTSFYADYDSGKATVGVPVTFTARANCGEEGSTYEFYLDGERAQERSEKNTFTTSFTQSGDYDIAVAAYNRYGFREIQHYRETAHFCYHETGDGGSVSYRYGDYHVVDSYSYDGPELVGIGCIDSMFSYLPGVEVHAAGGTAPYTYCFMIPDLDAGNNYWGNDIEHFNAVEDKYGWELRYKDNKPYLYHDYSPENTVYIPLNMFAPRSGHDIVIQAKDADGKLTETRTIYFDDEILVG